MVARISNGLAELPSQCVGYFNHIVLWSPPSTFAILVGLNRDINVFLVYTR